MQNKELKGKWEWNQLFTYARVIHFWRVWPPSDFFRASQEDRAFAVAFYESEMGIQAWDSYVASLKHKADMANLSPNKE